MKEYICKESMRTILDNFGVNYNYLQGIEDIPTVTKADICREFLDSIPKHYFNPSYCGELTEIRVSVRVLYDLVEIMEQRDILRSDLGFAKDSPKLTDEEINNLLSCVSPNEINSVMDYNSLIHQIYSQKSLTESYTKNTPDEIILGADVFDFLLANCPVEIRYFYDKETSYHQFLGLRVYIDYTNKDRVYVIPKMQY